MIKTMQRGIWVVLVLALALSGCGRKEAPQAVMEGAKPALTDLRHEVNGNILELYFSLQGSPEGVGYQIDRAEIDPYCDCPGMWRRYLAQEPMPKQVDKPHTRFINLKTTKRTFAFRIRAVDAAGNLGPWSPIIRARGVDLFDQ